MGKPTGRRPHFRRLGLARRYRLSDKQQRELTHTFCMQLCLCKSEAARRLLLGVSK